MFEETGDPLGGQAYRPVRQPDLPTAPSPPATTAMPVPRPASLAPRPEGRQDHASSPGPTTLQPRREPSGAEPAFRFDAVEGRLVPQPLPGEDAGSGPGTAPAGTEIGPALPDAVFPSLDDPFAEPLQPFDSPFGHEPERAGPTGGDPAPEVIQ